MSSWKIHGRLFNTGLLSLQLISRLLWLAFPDSLACSWLLPLSVLGLEERDRRKLLAGGTVLLTCHSIVCLAAHPPGDPMQGPDASIACHMTDVCPALKQEPAFSMGHRRGAVCPAMWMVMQLSHCQLVIFLCHLSGMNLGGDEEVTDFLILWWTMFWLPTGGEKRTPKVQSLSAAIRAFLGHPDTKMR